MAALPVLSVSSPDAAKLPRGVAETLRRLESAEATAYERWQQAVESGDPVRIKVERENWLRIGDSLRRYDLAVEAARRERVPSRGRGR